MVRLGKIAGFFVEFSFSLYKVIFLGKLVN